MSDLLPSLSSLRAFEATARHLSMTLAAEELHVTPGAVSLQVRELETSLNIPLFKRRPRSLSLTAEGAEYFATLRTAFRLVREATAAVRARARGSVLTVTCTATFAMQWLVPRIGRFEAQHPGIDVRISPSYRIMDFGRDGVDIAVRHGLGAYEGLVSQRLIDDDLIPVATPALVARLGAAPAPEGLAGMTLIHDVYRRDWELWLEAAGVDPAPAVHGPIFADGNGAVEAAKAGLGFALIRRSFIERELAEGQLAAPFPLGLASRLAYHLVYPATALERPAVAAFRRWLLAEATGAPT